MQPRIDGHLHTYRIVLDALIDAHRNIGETIEFGLQERTRWTAVWEMSGRCLSLTNCLLPQLAAGFASETVPTMRAIHEAVQILTVVTGPGEERLLRRWLDDEAYISAQQAREAENRLLAPYLKVLAEQGIKPNADQFLLGKQVYDTLSKPAHNMRIGFLESVSAPLKQFSYGSHPDPIQRAVHVEFGGQHVEEVMLVVGMALSTRFLGASFYAETIHPLQASLHAVRAAMPLDPRSVRGL